MTALGILTNAGPGFGPFVRTLDMARRIRTRLMAASEETVIIVMPWCYGDHQWRILHEECAGQPELLQHVWLSKDLATHYLPFLHKGNRFAETLANLKQYSQHHHRALKSLVSQGFEAQNLHGESKCIVGGSLLLEVSRNPVSAAVCQAAYYTSIGYLSSMLQVIRHRPGPTGIAPELAKDALPIAQWLEASFHRHFQPHPSCLSYLGRDRPRYERETATPPLIPQPQKPDGQLEPGVYLSCSGMDGLLASYRGLPFPPGPVYGNRKFTGVSQLLPPHFIAHQGIRAVVARAAWNTVWLANLSGTPLICPPYQTGDDPEIYLNLKTISKYGLARLWNPAAEDLASCISKAIEQKGNIGLAPVYQQVIQQFGSFDGIEWTAQAIAEDFLHGAR